MRNSLPKEAMFLLAQSWLPNEEKGGEGKLKVQWARVYRGVEDSELAQRNEAALKAEKEKEVAAEQVEKPVEKSIYAEEKAAAKKPAAKKPAAKKAE